MIMSHFNLKLVSVIDKEVISYKIHTLQAIAMQACSCVHAVRMHLRAWIVAH